MEQNKMTPALKVFLNNALSVLPGHTIKWDDEVETPVGIILKGGGTEGRDRQEKTALDIIASYNNTYGAGVSPEAVPDLLECLQHAVIQIEYLHSKFKETGSGNAVISACKAAIEKATIKL